MLAIEEGRLEWACEAVVLMLEGDGTVLFSCGEPLTQTGNHAERHVALRNAQMYRSSPRRTWRHSPQAVHNMAEVEFGNICLEADLVPDHVENDRSEFFVDLSTHLHQRWRRYSAVDVDLQAPHVHSAQLVDLVAEFARKAEEW